MNIISKHPKLITGLVLALLFAAALSLRVYFPYDRVFSGDWIKFTGVDAYYHMRLVDNLVHNFPQVLSFDPYLIFPEGSGGGGVFLFPRFIASVTWLIGLGSPAQHTIDVVGVYFPAVLGALTVIPVYFIGKELFGRWAGIIAASLLVLLPGEFLGRSILGFTDYHVAEVLLTSVTLLFLLLAVKTARQRQLTFSHFKRQDWATIARPVIYSLLAGGFLGVYMLTWMGGLLFAFIISIYFVIQFIIDHLKGKSNGYLCLVGVIFFLVVAIIYLPVFSSMFYRVPLVAALLLPLVLNGVSRLMAGRKIKPAYYPLTLVVLGLAGLGLFYLINPALFRSMLDAFGVFAPSGASLTTIEMQPFLFPRDEFTLDLAWGNFTTGFFLSIISFFIILIYFVIKRGNSEKTLLIVWSLVILAATLGQRRFAYYFAVNVALLTGYLSVLAYQLVRYTVDSLRGADTDYMSWQILGVGSGEATDKPVEALQEHGYYEVLGIARGTNRKAIKRAFHKLISQYQSDDERTERDEARFRELTKAYDVLSDPHKRAAYDRSLRSAEEREKARLKEAYQGGFRITARHVTMVLGAIVIFFLVFFWNIGPAISVAGQARFAPTDAWMSSLSWLQENTPEPFGESDLYYQLEDSYDYRSPYWLKQNVPNPSGDPDFYSQLAERYKYPESAYGVLAWWDYGYWITRIAHRVPVANPSQDPEALTSVANFFTSQDEQTASEITRKLGASYIIIDNLTSTSKFWAIATWAGIERSEFLGNYLLEQENQLMPVQFFRAEYYYSLASRLYNFDGQAVTPEKSMVITYEEREYNDGNVYKVITRVEEFESFQEVEDYLSKQEPGNHEIVGTNPFISPVPLEALSHYRLVYSSEESVEYSEVGLVPEIKIFEYID